MNLSSRNPPIVRNQQSGHKISGFSCLNEEIFVGIEINKRFQILEKIGDGGCGSIYGGFDSTTGKKVAIKIGNDGQYSDMLVKEAAILGLFSNENIVKLLDTGNYHGKPFIVMELLQGQELSKMLESGIEWNTGKDIILQICSALKAVHEKGLVHRDVKPDNVFVTANGAKLLDFGIASSPGKNENDGKISGTPNYIAPEILKSQEYDHRSDIYSLGVIIYNILSGEQLYTGNEWIIIIKALNIEPAPPSKVCPSYGIPEELDKIVLRALKKDPNLRYQTVDELIEDLKKCTVQPDKSKGYINDSPTIKDITYNCNN